MPVMKTPGVYIVEKNAFPNSVVEVATAVPAFIGYTERADDRGKSLSGKPWRISSLNEYHQYFGFAPKPTFDIVDLGAANAAGAEFAVAGKGYKVTQTTGRFNLYRGMLHFFQNGGGPCFVVSVGQYGQVKDGPAAAASVERKPLEDALGALETEQEPTMLVIPEAVLLDFENCIGLQQAMLKHCGLTMRNRVSILDVWGGDKELKDKPVDNFRSLLGVDQLDFGSAYYPFLHTSLVQDRDLGFGNVATLDKLQDLLRADLNLGKEEPSEPKPKLQWQAIKELSQDWHSAYQKRDAKPAALLPPTPPAVAAHHFVISIFSRFPPQTLQPRPN